MIYHECRFIGRMTTMRSSQKWKRIFAAVLCLTLLMASLPAFAAESYAYITGDAKINLRRSASQGSKVLGSYPQGTKVTVLDDGTTWTKVQVDGKTGYMMSKYLSTAKSSHIMYVRTYTGVKLRLREKATVFSDILGAYSPGTVVVVLDRGSAWTKVRVDGKVGYMGSQYLSATRP